MAVLKLKTAPAAMPVTLDEVKANSRIDHNNENTLIETMIAAATAHLDGYEGALGRCLITQTWEMFLDAFDDETITIPLGPIGAVTKIEYLSNGAYTEWVSSGNWTASVAAFLATITPVGSWPTPDDTANAVRITFTAGYGATSASVPAPIKYSIMMMVADMYENRGEKTETSVSENPTPGRLSGPFRRMAV
jgi:uncharacterized phiE125 gp8 family phage protein